VPKHIRNLDPYRHRTGRYDRAAGRHVITGRIQLDGMICQRQARLLVGEQPPPLPLAGDVNRTQD
jgi:hypothetical protein